ncbi:hypothetical protein [Streptomyces sp. NPDC001815]|uniref:hypothetical protein n=1 Tax=Streptomyces sp. NPDC001815 TaxID=3154526 RepID=UPI00331EBF32
MSTDRHLRLQQPVMGALFRLAADAMAVLLMVAIAVIAWIVAQTCGGGTLLASLLAIPASVFMAAAINHIQRRARR